MCQKGKKCLYDFFYRTIGCAPIECIKGRSINNMNEQEGIDVTR